MYEIKKQIYLYLSKNQKSALINYLRIFVKKWFTLSSDEIFDKFIQEEKYYIEINASRFEFFKDFIYDETFIADTNKFICECKKYYEYKQSQKPLLEKQKIFEKEKREFLKRVKMSKEKPTPKQLYYYKKLCKKYNIEIKELNSKLEAVETIDAILNKYSQISLNIPE